MDSLEAVSPIDGRYRKQSEPLARIFSDIGLSRYRIIVEIEYLIALADYGIGVRKLSRKEKSLLRGLSELSLGDAKIIQDIERKGYKNIKATNHDVKAIEYFLRDKLEGKSFNDCIEFLHFALTSEDVNNISYALMLSDAVGNELLPYLEKIKLKLEQLAGKYKKLPILARTHGQPATPTTFGKEFNVFASRLKRQLLQLRTFHILAKLNGATGNYNAHLAAYPKTNWTEFTKEFIEHLNKKRTIPLEINLVTTQIEPHDTYAELFGIFRRINTILIDFDQDMWRYISDNWIVQKTIEGEIGSSTMPHKVNPIKFENSEGNLGIANALFSHFSTKLPISRLQRDLSDSTVERNFGTAFAHCIIGYENIFKGLELVNVDEEKVKNELREHPEVIAEAIQTILRREGIPMPYEKLKTITRGHKVNLKTMRGFINSLEIRPGVKKELLKLTPENYIGLAEILAKEK